MKTWMFTAIVATIALSAVTAEAGKGDRQQYWKQQQMLKEEFRRAKEVGGYNDPLTALSNLLNGRVTPKDIQSPITDVYDTPGYGTIRLKGTFN